MEYKERPQPELLIRIPNPNKRADFAIKHETTEFTSLCPLNLTQPDYATITIHIVPNDWLVELKSLKFFLVSFRQCPIFHEAVPSYILECLVKLLKPRRMMVSGQFNTRGGLYTVVEATYDEETDGVTDAQAV